MWAKALDLSGFLAENPCGYWLFESSMGCTRMPKTYTRMPTITFNFTDSKTEPA